MPLTLPAYAKLNLSLAVGPPIPPAGMHPIASWMHAIDLRDDLEISRLTEGRPSQYTIRWAHDAPRQSTIDWPLDKDLAVRAHRLLEQHAGRPLPVTLIVSKRIPVGGGLGGGSSDAAAMLVGVNRLFELAIPLEELRVKSRALGSDVAYFIDDLAPPRPAIVSALGDRIERIQPSAAAVLLIFPPFGCPTGPVYRAFDALGARPLREAEIRDLPSSDLGTAKLFNDLLPAAEAIQPALVSLRERIGTALRLPVHMSGSGSALFVLVQDAAEIPTLTQHAQRAAPEAAFIPARLI